MFKVLQSIFKGFCKEFPLPLKSFTAVIFVIHHWFRMAFTSTDFHREYRALSYSLSITQHLLFTISTPYLCKITSINSAITCPLLSSPVGWQVLVCSLCHSAASSIQNSRDRVVCQACQQVSSVSWEMCWILVRDEHKFDRRGAKKKSISCQFWI